VKFLLLFLLLLPANQGYDKYLIVIQDRECVIVQDPEKPVELDALLEYAINHGFTRIKIRAGEWQFSRPITITDHDAELLIAGESSRPVVKGNISITKSTNVTIENMVLVGNIDLDQTENIQIRSVYFDGGGLTLKGKKCNQPRECVSYNQNLRVEDCIFDNSFRGIFAERLENSLVQGNRFIGHRVTASCERAVIGIDLDGSSEDLDRPYELGHSKGNRIIQNTFEQEFTIGIRVRDSRANIIRDNHFERSYRALEFHDGARHNQVIGNYIGYLSQTPVTSACPGPCGIYVGPGSVNNIFVNNFFEQNFELQFLDTNRNKTFIIDESGNQNVFRSDFSPISH
jgi:hypothetical protein